MNTPISPKAIVHSGLCIGCGSCVAQTNVPGAKMQFDAYGELKPYGPQAWYKRPTENLTNTCPFSPAAKNEDELGAELFPDSSEHSPELGKYLAAYVGHVSEADFREQGSSGGLVTWVATELLRKGLVDGVAHVVATEDAKTEGRFFRYRLARTADEVRAGAKSRYYPIELSEVIKKIKAVPGRYAIVGIPCFIKAVHLLRRQDPLLRERIRFTLGLFCGHMKSARFVESFAWQMKVPIEEVKSVEFRYKDPGRPANWYNAMLTLYNGGQINKDWWHLADGDWGAGFFMNSACNFCDDVVAETADISFGDAWVEPYSSDGRGTNVVVVRSPVIHQLVSAAIDQGRLNLTEVDGEFVAKTQAAGFRQRREGLAYRLTWPRKGLMPVKRVAPDATTLTRQRKLIYRMRYFVAKWSHAIFRFARALRQPKYYITWGRFASSIYHGFAYHKGKPAEMIKRFKEFRKL